MLLSFYSGTVLFKSILFKEVIHNIKVVMHMAEKAANTNLIKKSRKIIYLVAFILVLGVIANSYFGNRDTVALADSFGLLAFTFLSIALMVTPVRVLFPKFALNPVLYHARRAVGVSAFGFALLHYFSHLADNFLDQLIEKIPLVSRFRTYQDRHHFRHHVREEINFGFVPDYLLDWIGGTLFPPFKFRRRR